MDVVRKDGLILIREMATEVKNMMDFKMSAVMVNKIVNTCNVVRRKRTSSRNSVNKLYWLE